MTTQTFRPAPATDLSGISDEAWAMNRLCTLLLHYGMPRVEPVMTNATSYAGSYVIYVRGPKAGREEIRLSRVFARHDTRAEVNDTILHEIGHKIAGHEAGHGESWKALAPILGFNPNRAHPGPPEEVKAEAQRRRAARGMWVGACGAGCAARRVTLTARARNGHCTAHHSPLEWTKYVDADEAAAAILDIKGLA